MLGRSAPNERDDWRDIEGRGWGVSSWSIGKVMAHTIHSVGEYVAACRHLDPSMAGFDSRLIAVGFNAVSPSRFVGQFGQGFIAYWQSGVKRPDTVGSSWNPRVEAAFRAYRAGLPLGSFRRVISDYYGDSWLEWIANSRGHWSWKRYKIATRFLASRRQNAINIAFHLSTQDALRLLHFPAAFISGIKEIGEAGVYLPKRLRNAFPMRRIDWEVMNETWQYWWRMPRQSFQDRRIPAYLWWAHAAEIAAREKLVMAGYDADVALIVAQENLAQEALELAVEEPSIVRVDGRSIRRFIRLLRSYAWRQFHREIASLTGRKKNLAPRNGDVL